MSCFPCFSCNDKKAAQKKPKQGISAQMQPCQPQKEALLPQPRPENHYSSKPTDEGRPTNDNNNNNNNNINADKDRGKNNIAAETFTFRELAAATRNFRQECLIGEGGFGRVYKGKIEKTNQIVAVKQLDRNGLQGNREFLVEVLMLSLLHHENLVNLIGYCADGDQRLLVYEYMPLGSVEDNLLDLEPDEKPLDWFVRMKIALGASKGLEYLHDKANPPVIYRDLKASNILLDTGFHAKLSDFGLAKLGPTGDKSHVSSRIMGTYGYCAPEYQRTGQLTVKSDVYSFGVVLLELITGKRVIDNTRPTREQNLVSWARPIFKDPNRYLELADPLLQRNFPVRAFNQAVAVAAMCLNEEPAVRPLISDVVTALTFLGTDSEADDHYPSTATHDDNIPSPPPPVQHSGRGRPNSNLVDINAKRQRAVAEAIKWGSASRNNAVQRTNATPNASSL